MRRYTLNENELEMDYEMTKTLALIHTSMVFINVELTIKELLNEKLPGVRQINIVDDSLLPDVISAGCVTASVCERMCAYAEAAQTAGADAILSLCSSLGPAADEAAKRVTIPLIKIDEAMAEAASSMATRIGVLATLATTLPPTCGLIRQKASAMGKSVEIVDVCCSDAFQVLMSGEKARHDDIVAEAAKTLAADVQVLVLAQGSMARLAPRLENETGIPVLSSPRLGIEHTAGVLGL